MAKRRKNKAGPALRKHAEPPILKVKNPNIDDIRKSVQRDAPEVSTPFFLNLKPYGFVNLKRSMLQVVHKLASLRAI